MEGPGGYQFVGRTLQMWNRHRQTAEFPQPWLLRFFDQIQFYEVDEAELAQIREGFPLGHFPIDIEETEFSLVDYQAFLQEHRIHRPFCLLPLRTTHAPPLLQAASAPLVRMDGEVLLKGRHGFSARA